MKDAFIVSNNEYHIADGVWTPNILKATNYGVGDEAHIMDRARRDYVKQRLWTQDHHFHMRVHIGVVNTATGGFVVEAIKDIKP